MNTENKIAEQMHQKTIDLQAGIIANQQKSIDVANVRIGDLVEANANLEKTIQWYRDTRTEGMVLAARADIAAASIQAAPVGNPRDWLMDGSLIYRLNDDETMNVDEINVTMAHGSRKQENREAAAAGLLNLICAADCAAAAPAAPLPALKNGFLYQEGLDIKAVLYTDAINDQQVCRDDLWLATTEALNKLAEGPAAPIQAAPLPEQPGPSAGSIGEDATFDDLLADYKLAESRSSYVKALAALVANIDHHAACVAGAKAEYETAEISQEVARLQNALCFWLPSVTDREDEIADRILQDAFLLVGCDGNMPEDFKSAQELGWTVFGNAASPSPAPAQPTPATQAELDEFLAQYEWRTDEFCHALTGDERTMLHDYTVMLGEEFAIASGAAPAQQQEPSAGLEAAAALIEKKVADYDREHGNTDPDTGTREYPGDGAQWIGQMEELAEEIRAQSSASVETAAPGASTEDKQ